MAMLSLLSAVHGASRPNILFLMSDEMDGRILDPSSPQVKPPMPNLNRLAASGALFTGAYNQAPQCVPSRSAMMVGLRTDQIGVIDNWFGGVAINGNASSPDDYCVKEFGASYCMKQAARQAAPQTFVDRVHDAGYGIHLYGKMHAGYGLDRYPGALNAWPFTNPKSKTTDESHYAKELREWTRGIGTETNMKGCEQASSAEHPPDDKKAPASSNDYQCVQSCVAQLRAGLFNQTAPQFLYCSILVPHPAYASNSTYMRAVANLSVGAPALVPKNASHPNDMMTSKLKGYWDEDKYAAEDVIYFRRVYFSMCYEADTLLGAVINALDASGARDNTFVMMVSDHGENNYEHRQLGKNNFYDSASRLAMVLSGPGVAPHQVVPALASLNDVYPTVLDMAGVTRLPSNLAGSSLLGLVAAHGAQPTSRRDYVVAQYHSVYSVTGSYMIRQGDFKLIEFSQLAGGPPFPPQLFNLRDDPWELHDIAATSPGVVGQLSALLQTEVNVTAMDAEAKSLQKQLFLHTVWRGSSECQALFESIYGKGSLDGTDAQRIADWLGEPCPFSHDR